MAWLNIALAPCAMAMGESPACPHGAAPANSELVSHEGHHGGSTIIDCAWAESDCCGDNDVLTEMRSQSSADKEAVPDCATASVPDVTSLLSMAAVGFADTGPPERLVTSPPIYVLNCVFLI